MACDRMRTRSPPDCLRDRAGPATHVRTDRRRSDWAAAAWPPYAHGSVAAPGPRMRRAWAGSARCGPRRVALAVTGCAGIGGGKMKRHECCLTCPFYATVPVIPRPPAHCSSDGAEPLLLRGCALTVVAACLEGYNFTFI